jgi:predicted DNA-binding protein with PD1-like motif
VQAFEVRDDELMSAIAQQAEAAGIRNGAIVSLVGATDTFAISTMPAGDASADVITEYALPAEMSGTGEIVDGVVHIHAVMAVEGDRAVSGHLHRAQVQTHFARAYVLPKA